MAAGMFLFSAVDTQAKFLTATLHPIQIVWFRQLGLLIGVAVLLGLRGRQVLVTAHPKMQIMRGLMAAGSATLFVIAVSYVPLADAIAVSFVAPFFVTIMGALFLKEPVGKYRWGAVIVGFIGTLIVIRPGSGAIHPAVLLVLVAAGLFALRQVVSRMLAAGDRTETTLVYTGLVGSFALTLPLPFVWIWPSGGTQIALLIGLALLAGVAEVLVIKALEIGQSVVLAPMQYSLMIWGTFYGFVVFGQVPDGWTWVGASLIMATGLFVLFRERRARRRAVATNVD